MLGGTVTSSDLAIGAGSTDELGVASVGAAATQDCAQPQSMSRAGAVADTARSWPPAAMARSHSMPELSRIESAASNGSKPEQPRHQTVASPVNARARREEAERAVNTTVYDSAER